MINSSDARVCYDRIVLLIASLSLQRIELSKEAVFSSTNTLQSATRDVDKTFGISIEIFFPTTPQLQESRYGNGIGYTIWAMISAILLTIIKDKGYGLNVSPNTPLWIMLIPSIRQNQWIYAKKTKIGWYMGRYTTRNWRSIKTC